MATIVQTPRALYRHLLRRLQVLPVAARDHYKHRIRQVKACETLYVCEGKINVNLQHDVDEFALQNFISLILQEFIVHSDEDDPERIQQIIERAVNDIEWIVKQVMIFK